MRLLFSFTATATTEIYTLSLHDALPISEALNEFKIRASYGSTGNDLDVDNEKITPFSYLYKYENSSGYMLDRKSTRLNSSHVAISYAVFCLKKKKNKLLTKNTSRTRPHT